MQVPNRALRRALDAAASGPDLARRLAALLPQAAGLLDAAERLVDRVDTLVDRLDRTEAELHAVVQRAAATEATARSLVGELDGAVRRARALVDAYEPALARSAETVAYASERFGPDQVDSFIALLSHEAMLREIRPLLPVLGALETVAPDLKELIAVSRGLNELMGSVPGMGRAKRRVDDELAELQNEEADGPPRPS